MKNFFILILAAPSLLWYRKHKNSTFAHIYNNFKTLSLCLIVASTIHNWKLMRIMILFFRTQKGFDIMAIFIMIFAILFFTFLIMYFIFENEILKFAILSAIILLIIFLFATFLFVLSWFNGPLDILGSILVCILGGLIGYIFYKFKNWKFFKTRKLIWGRNV